MKNILIIGAGRSATTLIHYLSEAATAKDWKITVADAQIETAQQQVKGLAKTEAVGLDIYDTAAKDALISEADVVVSMLPAHLHMLVAVGCLQFDKPLLMASYISTEMNALHEAAKQKNLLFLCECGLDPGIDHMSAMQVIHRIKAEGGEISSFKSFCGGLIAPQSEGDNPWKYKFTWSPRNVVLAGQGGVSARRTAQSLEKGQHKYIPYWQLFRQVTPVEIPGYGHFEAYPNRNSLAYQEAYGLQQAHTLLRGTLRRPGFCAAWQVLVQLGLTDDSYEVDTKKKTYADFMASFLPSTQGTLLERLSNYVGLSVNAEPVQKLKWLGILENTPIDLEKATPAQILQKLLEEKWKIQPGDQDLVVMQHQFKYAGDIGTKTIHTSLAVEGGGNGQTAMAKTVGFPLGMATKLVLEDKIPQRGVILPIYPEIYTPVLSELNRMNVKFVEATISDSKIF